MKDIIKSPVWNNFKIIKMTNTVFHTLNPFLVAFVNMIYIKYDFNLAFYIIYEYL